MAPSKKKKTSAANPGAKAQPYQMDPQVEAEVRRVAKEAVAEALREFRGEMRKTTGAELEKFEGRVAQIAQAQAVNVVQNSGDVMLDFVGRAFKVGSDLTVGSMLRNAREKLSAAAVGQAGQK